ncbi:putative protein isoform X1 [Capsicum chacoense]|uniref:DUF3444 domain-containing protein n=1 Tax=Capsicum annuum TaxID=4072 RepID=A0A1U8E5K7_CAPAN|nr:uncharacterized protein LOC107839561 isoform X1 [Capsicum annuum]XP_016538587.1 uncharacterized protein LOC107839561 isoform X1 [Capsicum annuum]XP_016538589.1 uncharacterized protein LOC107839561 isoform X1 [Capsicum annuum]KAF3634943.1 putative receptor-like protein 12-like [Capsicum annuum]PHT63157.1 hypothetical protein T459_32966 [Capsicum annuum]
MMATEDKTLFCFCHWGRKSKVLPDGSTLYAGGITRQIIVKTGIKYNDFVNAVFDQLCLDPSDKILHFTVKFDRLQLIQLSDQEDVNSLLQFNDGSAHVYASSLEKEPYSILPLVGAEKVELTVDSDLEADTVADSVLPEVYDYHDAEFSDFDKHRAQDCFARDQIWACFDTVDGMPRFYMHIRKVVDSPEFKVLFSWLEAHPEDQKQKAWVRAELPVGCGKFRCGSKQFTFDQLIFSHQVQCEVDKTGVYIIYPRKGETWAVFKDWDISWSSDPDNHRKYKYEIVEILSDYVVDVGVQVCYLEKVTRFVSLFQRTRPQTEVNTFFIKPNKLYKFSHRIPSFKMTGTERESVPAGSFELHPICLPYNSNDIWYPGKVKEDCRTANSEPVENVLPVAVSLKSGDLNVIPNAIDGDSVKVQVSAKEMNISEKKRTQMSSCYANDGDFVHSCVKKIRQSIPDVPINLSCEADTELHSHTKSFDLSDTFEEFFCDFKMDRCMEKFEVNQVWAVYARNSTLPKTYALVKKIVSVPFKLHVVLLEVCAGPDNAAQSVCGTFKVENEKYLVFCPSSFSHVVKAVSVSETRFEIYPRGGEIWAMYKCLKKSGFDTDKFEYEIVEVIENSKDNRIQVSSMVRVNGFKSVFIRSQTSNSVILEDEFWRFSHQIPAFLLTGEKAGVLRGCWELDPASVPCTL